MPPTRRPNDPLIAQNRRARYEYSIVESIEAGIELTGPEVKSLRTGRIQLRDGYVRIENGQAWLMQVNIASYQHGNRNNPEPERRRRLLLHKREIEYLDGRVRTQGLTIIPPKPPFGKVIWKLWLNSGVDLKFLKISSVKGVSCSIVALAGTSTEPKTTP